MPKIVKGGPLGLFKIHSVAEYQITKGDPCEKLKNFLKKVSVPKKIGRGPFSLVRFCMLR